MQGNSNAQLKKYLLHVEKVHEGVMKIVWKFQLAVQIIIFNIFFKYGFSPHNYESTFWLIKDRRTQYRFWSGQAKEVKHLWLYHELRFSGKLIIMITLLHSYIQVNRSDWQGYVTDTSLAGSLDGNSLRPATRYGGGSFHSAFSADLDDHRTGRMTDGIRQLPRYYPKYQTVVDRDGGGLGPVYEDTPDVLPLYSQPNRSRKPPEAMFTETEKVNRKKTSTGTIAVIVLVVIFIVCAGIGLGIYFGRKFKTNHYCWNIMIVLLFTY